MTYKNWQADPWNATTDTVTNFRVQSTHYSGSYEPIFAPGSANFPDTTPTRYFMYLPFSIDVSDLGGSYPIALYDQDSSATLTRVTAAPGANEYRVPPAASENNAVIELNAAQAGHEIDYDYYGLGSSLNADQTTDFWDSTVGYIETEINPTTSSTLLIKRPKMRLPEFVLNNTGDTTIDLTALSSETWYALCAEEKEGGISAIDISTNFSTSAGGNWTISGNQLNMYDDIWDSDKKYCKATDGTDNYRVFGVFKTEAAASPTKADYIFYIPNIPYSKVYVTRESNILVNSASNIEFNTIKYDINSEYDAVTNYRYTAKLGQIVSVKYIILGDLTLVKSGQRNGEIKKNNTTTIGRDYWTTASNVFTLLLNPTSPDEVMDKDDYIEPLITLITAGTITGSVGNYFYVSGGNQ